ncbi:unnamed protein product [Macrosiphum euphorbiae]|uniref:Uncharacterized protein n=1 Tax=Macrosiphum euphorbiae TaxID=13131 RepID=A0AAV0VMX0_9HEMI|nr:unnamed protein product [Macrosiphum euphorbiae]
MNNPQILREVRLYCRIGSRGRKVSAIFARTHTWGPCNWKPRNPYKNKTSTCDLSHKTEGVVFREYFHQIVTGNLITIAKRTDYTTKTTVKHV